ncbi:ABC transporter permease [Blattabacterium cuenoti]|uniref:ABC transporter permease n=1 Tax=Blattabacterium cuenoti TaxID=1653831 RepID=UPI00163C0118|nr:ABC transporter permease [Blattabacterium cuenoti]
MYFQIAIRYLFSKKRINIVNIIVILSIISLSISAFSLSIILFIFSGLEDLSKNFYDKNYPDIRISCLKKKELMKDNNFLIIEKKLKSVKGIENFSKTIKIKIMLNYIDNNDKKYFLYLKGIDSKYENVIKNFKKVDTINSFQKIDDFPVYIGLDSFSFLFHDLQMLYNNDIRNKITNNHHQMMELFFFFYKNDKPLLIRKNLFIKGFFYSEKMNDSKYIFCDIHNIQNLMNEKYFQTIDIKVDHTNDITKVKQNLKNKLGNKFDIKSRIDQEEYFHKILKIERIFIYSLFSLISLIIGFNLYSAIFILQLDKKKQIFLLWSFGAIKIKNIFLYTGLIITIFGWLIGILLSFVIYILQKTYKIFKISENVIFPIKLTLGDLCLVTCTILTMGIILSFLSSERTIFIKNYK